MLLAEMFPSLAKKKKKKEELRVRWRWQSCRDVCVADRHLAGAVLQFCVLFSLSSCSSSQVLDIFQTSNKTCSKNWTFFGSLRGEDKHTPL